MIPRRISGYFRRGMSDCKRYTQAKQLLASRTWKYVQDYAGAKSEVIESIITRACADRPTD
jgi:hypothetical protein